MKKNMKKITILRYIINTTRRIIIITTTTPPPIRKPTLENYSKK